MSIMEDSKKVELDEVVLRLKNISKIYPGTVALEQGNLEIKRGEVHGIVGKNGAGKSTLMGIIAGIITPTTGEIQVDGKNFAVFSRIGSRKEKIAIVPQEPQVINDLTVAENLFIPDYPCRAKFVDWQKLCKAAKEILEISDLSIDVDIKMGDLSILLRKE